MKRVVVDHFGEPEVLKVVPRRRVMGYRVQKLRIPHQDWFEEDLRAMLRLLREGRINPVVAERLLFTDARHAHELLERSAAKGKLVLVP